MLDKISPTRFKILSGHGSFLLFLLFSGFSLNFLFCFVTGDRKSEATAKAQGKVVGLCDRISKNRFNFREGWIQAVPRITRPVCSAPWLASSLFLLTWVFPQRSKAVALGYTLSVKMPSYSPGMFTIFLAIPLNSVLG